MLAVGYMVLEWTTNAMGEGNNLRFLIARLITRTLGWILWVTNGEDPQYIKGEQGSKMCKGYWNEWPVKKEGQIGKNSVQKTESRSGEVRVNCPHTPKIICL